jgi:hypothetical protein
MLLSGRRVASAIAAVAACLSWLGCKSTPCDPTNPDLSCYDGGSLPPYVCTSAQVAQSDTNDCGLTNCVSKLDYISGPQVQQWYSFKMPSTTDAKSLVHVSAGFSAPGTPVDLEIGLFKSDGTTALAPQVVDNHGAGSPKPLDIIVPYTTPNDTLVISANDKNFNHTANPGYDQSNPFQVIACVLEDPDPNVGPNPVPITLTGPAGNLTGSAPPGYLSTNGRTDKFTVAVPASGRQILYVHLTGGCVSDGGTPQLCLPPPQYLMSFSIKDPQGLPVASEKMNNVFLPIDLATARLAPAAGNYEIDVTGVDPQGQSTAMGDLRLQYTLSVGVLVDQDVNEPNDSLSTATKVPMTGPAAYPGGLGSMVVTKTGRISYVVDPDWYELDFPGSGSETMLHYKLTWGAGPGRFPPLFPQPWQRQLQLFKQIATGATPMARTTTCLNDPVACPKGYDPTQTQQQILVQTFCNLYDPLDAGNAGVPRCILSDREENLSFDKPVAATDLHNFEGMIPIAAGTTQYFLVVQAQAVAPYDGWADDVDYTLSLEWLSSPAKAPQTLAVDVAGSWTFPYSAGATTVSGSIASGYGRIIYNMPDGGQGVRAPLDYDAVVSQSDVYEFDFAAGATDRAWELQWDVSNDSNGGQIHDLALEVTFCDGTNPGTLPPCAPGSPVLDSNGNPQVIAYDPNAGQWFNPLGQYGQRQNPWDHSSGGGVTTTDANDFSCMCIPKPWALGGKFIVNVVGADRDSYLPASYTLRTALAPYSTEYTGYDGGVLCPQAQADGGGGCGFQ